MFPRFVSFDFTDFKIIQNRIVKARYFKTFKNDYIHDFFTFYKKNVNELNNEALAIFFFKDFGKIKSYFFDIKELRIPIYSDHYGSPIDEIIKVLLIV